MTIRRTILVPLAVAAFAAAAPATGAHRAPASGPPSDGSAGGLTFEARVRAQEAIESTAYAHQIGTTKPFAAAVPRALLEDRVRRYLQESAALDERWRTPITAEALRSEWQRIASETRMPERLREIHAALHDDPLLIQECYVRPILADRLARSFYAFDAGLHADERAQAEALRRDLVQGAVDAAADRPGRTVTEARRVAPGGEGRAAADDAAALAGGVASPASVAPDDGAAPPAGPAAQRTLLLDAGQYRRWRSAAPRQVGLIGPVVEERDAFVIRTALQDSIDSARVASFTVPKRSWDDWWSAARAAYRDDGVPAVADASLPLPAPAGPAAQRFDAASTPACASENTWSAGNLAQVPDGRTDVPAVWTGSLMIVWGGYNSVALGDGGRYDPVTDTWTPVSTAGAPAPRWSHVAVWTGREMIVWGGNSLTAYLNTGARYDPTTDTWTPTSTTNAPQGRSFAAAVWTGREMIVWGGRGTSGNDLGTGGRYDPEADAWVATATLGAPTPRELHTAVWTGREMVVWGGSGGGPNPYLGTGGKYDPARDAWSPIATTNAPAPRYFHTATWTGAAMIVWGGYNAGGYLGSGGRYNAAADTWLPTSASGAPLGRQQASAVWDGARVLVWGGYGGSQFGPNFLDTGGLYDPAADAWTPMSTAGAPAARSGHVAVWTGHLMVVWGGGANTGGRYDPALDVWTPTSIGTAPAARASHTAVWTGREMIVWGGGDCCSLNSGGRYDPTAATWTPTSLVGAPSPRSLHSAIWTGQEMVVWGGGAGGAFASLNTGGRYDPIADAWTPTAITGAPAGRYSHTAVWTGREMIVWGGLAAGMLLDSGGRYDPATDTWTTITSAGAPLGRWHHVAVWSGTQMVVFGGNVDSGYDASGGRYDPAADAWHPTSTAGAPAGQDDAAAVWTGTDLVVWGGSQYDDIFTNRGGRYDPLLDRWRPVATSGAPFARAEHTAVWTGSRMLVWGGREAGSKWSTGGLYDPVADAWVATSTAGAPIGRFIHSAVWTGDAMIVWGGLSNTSLGSGGIYIPFSPPDQDGDGWRVCDGDCNDHDAAVHPGAAETCDGVDDNCDGRVDEGFDVGGACIAPVDECHQLVGTNRCLPDGSATTCIGEVTVHDVTPPAFEVHADAAILWPPDHRLVPVHLGWTARDACDAGPVVTLLSVTSNEADGVDGGTSNDISGADVGTADDLVYLRAERSGTGPGRVYRLTYQAVDASGNAATASVTVTVPRSMRSGLGGTRLDSRSGAARPSRVPGAAPAQR